MTGLRFGEVSGPWGSVSWLSVAWWRAFARGAGRTASLKGDAVGRGGSVRARGRRWGGPCRVCVRGEQIRDTVCASGRSSWRVCALCRQKTATADGRHSGDARRGGFVPYADGKPPPLTDATGGAVVVADLCPMPMENRHHGARHGGDARPRATATDPSAPPARAALLHHRRERATDPRAPPAGPALRHHRRERAPQPRGPRAGALLRAPDHPDPARLPHGQGRPPVVDAVLRAPRRPLDTPQNARTRAPDGAARQAGPAARPQPPPATGERPAACTSGSSIRSSVTSGCAARSARAEVAREQRQCVPSLRKRTSAAELRAGRRRPRRRCAARPSTASGRGRR